MQDPNDGSMHRLPEGIAALVNKVAGDTAVPIFRIGEVIELRGGRFRVAAIGRKFMRLEGLPGTHVGEDPAAPACVVEGD